MEFQALYRCGPYGPCKYEEALQIQNKVHAKKKDENPPTSPHFVLFAEHDSIYTYPNFGWTTENSRLLIKKGTLEKPELPAPLMAVDRPVGSITYHGPGQLVVYLIMDLRELSMGPLEFPLFIDATLIKLLATYGIAGKHKPEQLPEAADGVWIREKGLAKKIASRGIYVRKNITRFGFALNVSTDLSFFKHIYPCGLPIQITSMKEVLGFDLPIRDVAERYFAILKDTFQKEKASGTS